MNPDWLFWHFLDALRVPSSRPERDVYCPAWLARTLGGAGLVFLVALIAAAFPR